jgi:hypothetical protein
MYLSTALALAGTASVAAAHPYLTRRAVPAIPNTSTFDILLAGNLNGDMGTLDESVKQQPLLISRLPERLSFATSALERTSQTVMHLLSSRTVI